MSTQERQKCTSPKLATSTHSPFLPLLRPLFFFSPSSIPSLAMFFKVPIVALAAVASLVSAVQGIGLEIKNPAQGVTFKPGDRMVVDLGYRVLGI